MNITENVVVIKSRFKDYNVSFVDNFDNVRNLSKEKNTFFVIDVNVYNLYKEHFQDLPEDKLYLLDAVEDNKCIGTVLGICEMMTNMPSKRNTHLVSIGGGITQDITGFVATSLYRGIKWTFYPTTLLAACDSCIGGKSSLNYKGYKNLLGTFYPPDEIFVNPNVFKTLFKKDYYSGLGEVVKFNVIAGSDGVDKIEKDLDDILNYNYEKLNLYVKTSLQFKKKFIEEDEFDKGIRILLNFAHTFGHAYESISDYAIPHGSAVAMGMITANHISVLRGYISSDYAERIELFCNKILTEINIKEEWFELNKIISAIKKDKKQTSNSIKAVLINSNSNLEVFDNIEIAEIEKAVKHLLDIIK